MPTIAYLLVLPPMSDTSKMMTTHAKTTYEITPAKTPVWFLVRTHRPIFHTIPLPFLVSGHPIKNLAPPVYLTSCSALSSDPLPLLVDTTCHASFLHPPDRVFRLTEWANLQGRLEDGIPSCLELHEVSIGTWVEKLSGAILEALAATHSKICPRDDRGPWYRIVFSMKYVWWIS